MTDIEESRKMLLIGSKRNIEERGAIFVVVAALIVALFFFVGTIYILGYGYLVRNELQTVSDSAAHAGASLLCSDDDCWENAVKGAARVIAKQVTHAGIGGQKQLLFDFSSSPGPVWKSSQIEVTIERGIYNPHSGFRSLETMAMTLSGFSKFVTANAVRVSLHRPQITPFMQGMLEAHFPILVSSIAVIEEMHSVCAAPFALPVCALASQKGKIDQRISNRDRLFGAVQGHCPDGKLCENYPSFPIAPMFNNEVSSSDSTDPFKNKIEPFARAVKNFSLPSPNPLNFPRISSVFFNFDKKPAFNTDRYDATSDNYGVIGIPGATKAGDATRSNVIKILQKNGPGCEANLSLGDKFAILPGGLTETADKNLIWERISGSAEMLRSASEFDAKYPPYFISGISPQYDLYTRQGETAADKGSSFEFNSYYGLCNFQDDGDPKNKYAAWCAKGYPFAPQIAKWSGNGSPATDKNSGICNSARLEEAIESARSEGLLTNRTFSRIEDPSMYGGDSDLEFMLPKTFAAHYPQAQILNPLNFMYPGYWIQEPELYAQIMMNMLHTRVWITDVAIIAQPNGLDCTQSEQPIDAAQLWDIIGYSRMIVYDLDIGEDPPTKPMNANGTPLSFFANDEVKGHIEVRAFKDRSHPYGFVDSATDRPQRCNVIRARILPGDSVVPRTNPSGARRTVLVQ